MQSEILLVPKQPAGMKQVPHRLFERDRFRVCCIPHSYYSGNTAANLRETAERLDPKRFFP
jgi:hypothetical protein